MMNKDMERGRREGEKGEEEKGRRGEGTAGQEDRGTGGQGDRGRIKPREFSFSFYVHVHQLIVREDLGVGHCHYCCSIVYWKICLEIKIKRKEKKISVSNLRLLNGNVRREIWGRERGCKEEK